MNIVKQKSLFDENKELDELNLLFREKQYGEVISKGKNYINIFPVNHELYKLIGSAYLYTEDLINAKYFFEKAIKLNFSDHKCYVLLGSILNKLQKYDEAIDLNKIALNFFPKSPNLFFNLGNSYLKLGRISESIIQYQKAIDHKKDFYQAYNNLGKALISAKKYENAIISFKKALKIKPNYISAYENLASLYYSNSKNSSKKFYKKILEIDPENANAKHMLFALNGITPLTAPKNYVVNLFNNFSESFDEILVSKLGYEAPKILKNYFKKFINPKENILNAVDLGCGTGLSGIEFKEFANKLFGIDLSVEMLKKAEQIHVYDELILGDVSTVLENQTLKFDLFIATDTFIYIGDLNRLFSAVKKRSTNTGFFAFCTEHTEQNDYHLRKSGRFAHSKTYIKQLCKTHGFKILFFQRQKLRKTGENWVEGGYYILRSQD